jgi:hypothetical protein
MVVEAKIREEVEQLAQGVMAFCGVIWTVFWVLGCSKKGLYKGAPGNGSEYRWMNV